MKIKEIRKLSLDELKTKVNSLKKDLFNSRFKRVNGQLTDTAKFAQTKKDVARALTLLKVKK
jgi:large subunit ribosomal protein L29